MHGAIVARDGKPLVSQRSTLNAVAENESAFDNGLSSHPPLVDNDNNTRKDNRCDFGFGISRCQACASFPHLKRGCHVCRAPLCRPCFRSHVCPESPRLGTWSPIETAVNDGELDSIRALGGSGPIFILVLHTIRNVAAFERFIAAKRGFPWVETIYAGTALGPILIGPVDIDYDVVFVDKYASANKFFELLDSQQYRAAEADRVAAIEKTHILLTTPLGAPCHRIGKRQIGQQEKPSRTKTLCGYSSWSSWRLAVPRFGGSGLREPFVNDAEFDKFRAFGNTGPVFIWTFYKIKDVVAFQRFLESLQFFAFAENIYVGNVVRPTCIGPDEMDYNMVAIDKYPSADKFFEMVDSASYQAAYVHRHTAVEKAQMVVTASLDEKTLTLFISKKKGWDSFLSMVDRLTPVPPMF